MSTFHTITVTHGAGKAAPRGLGKLINEVGGLKRTGEWADTQRACELLSKHPGVDHVTLTIVQERHVGVWRNGRRMK